MRTYEGQWKPEWQDAWISLGMLAVVALATFLGTIFLSSKQVDYYYLSRAGVESNGFGGTCVYAHWTWHADERAFCTEDSNRALDFVSRANQSLLKK